MQRPWKVCRSQCMEFSVLLFPQTCTHKIYTTKVYFHAKLIGASPVVIACKTTKLFKFLHSQTQHNPTIGLHPATLYLSFFLIIVYVIQRIHNSIRNVNQVCTQTIKTEKNNDSDQQNHLIMGQLHVCITHAQLCPLKVSYTTTSHYKCMRGGNGWMGMEYWHTYTCHLV